MDKIEQSIEKNEEKGKKHKRRKRKRKTKKGYCIKNTDKKYNKYTNPRKNREK